jgi:hypothetical protein
LDDYSDSITYRWTIRALYATGLALNAYVLWEMTLQDFEREILRAKIHAKVTKLLRPFTVQHQWKRSVGKMHFQAMEIVEETTPDA